MRFGIVLSAAAAIHRTVAEETWPDGTHDIDKETLLDDYYDIDERNGFVFDDFIDEDLFAQQFTPPPAYDEIDATAHALAVENDFCSDATLLKVQNVNAPAVIEASTYSARIGPEAPPFCGVPIKSTGIWYAVEGNGQVMRAEVTSMVAWHAPAISVFTGECADLQCVDGNVFGGDNGINSMVEWCAQANVVYYIYVHGYEISRGPIVMTVSMLDTECHVPVNDACSTATSMPYVKATQTRKSPIGNTAYATSDVQLGSTCYYTPREGRGVWYEVQGTGTTLEISTRQTSDTRTDKVTYVSVFTGKCDGEFQCISQTWGEGNQAGPNIKFCSTLGKKYYILISGTAKDTTEFYDVRVRNMGSDCTPPANDVCQGAITLDPAYPSNKISVISTTAGANPTGMDSCIRRNYQRSPAVWYKVKGTGYTMEVNTCNEITDYDTSLSVYTSGDGSCSNLQCVEGNEDDDSCWYRDGYVSRISWCSELGRTYYILVHGYARKFGTFQLEVKDRLNVRNDSPSGAINMREGYTYRWRNDCATADPDEPTPGVGTMNIDGSTCDSQNGWCGADPYVQNSLWYKFTAKTYCATIDARYVDAQLALYEAESPGNYSTYILLAANDDRVDRGSSKRYPYVEKACVVPGKTYMVQVDGYKGAVGGGKINLYHESDCPLCESESP